ncbi:MAG: hypothetical protein EAZ24_07770 [Burkholderiales bacterium]|nr:MAG: hypothetical protein EAZ24_07770 [Burkholderiales bacterium]
MSDKKTLLLVGGGHAHVEVLRRLAEKPFPDTDVALLDPSPSVWYSGMVPGVLAGHYPANDAKVNLWALCQKARVRFIEAAVTQVDPALQRVYTSVGDRHFYDVASFDIGSVSFPLPTTPGSYVVPVRPVDVLFAAINERDAIRSSGLNIQIVGGGAAALEVALALAYRWRGTPEKRIGIVSATDLLPGFPASARRTALAACKSLRVQVSEQSPVRAVEPTRLVLETGDFVPSQLTILATGYAPAPLLAEIEISKTDDGSISVNSGLQSRSHKNIFAAGDCASNPKVDIPKAGVFAVRQGPVLYENLRRAVRGGELSTYEHKPDALSLISLGDKRAIAARNGFALSGGWAWRWKHKIDREWIARYIG